MHNVVTDKITSPSPIPVHTVLPLRLGGGHFEVEMELKCSRCKKEMDPSNFYKNKSLTRGYGIYCKKCFGLRMKGRPQKKRDRREYNREYSQRPITKIKIRARVNLRMAVTLGKIIKAPCYICDNPKVEAHHEDYSEPYEVFWLCRACHKDRHDELKELGIKLNAGRI